MRDPRIWFLALLAGLAVTSTAAAQPALDRLEQQLLGKDAAAKPAPAPDPSGVRETGYLGIMADERGDPNRGLRVFEVLPEGPAAKAGILPDDWITRIDERPVRQMSDLASILERSSPGDQLVFVVVRGQMERKVLVTFGRRPPAEQRRFPSIGRFPPGPEPGLPPAGNVPPHARLPDALLPDRVRIEQLENRVAELERRLAELEQALRKVP